MDDELELPVIEHVSFAKTREVSEAAEDPFAQPGAFAKSLSGTSANFKRRVTNELKKYNRSADGSVESKQIDDSTEVTGYDAFGVVQPPHGMEGLAEIYILSSPHYSAVNAKVDNIVGLGHNFVETSKTKRAIEALEGNEKKLKKARQALEEHRQELIETLDSFNEEETLTEILIKAWRDYEVMGNGYIEVGRKRDGTIGYIGHVPAQSIRVRKVRDGFVQISANRAQFFANFGAGSRGRAQNPIGNDVPNELIHLKRYSPSNSYYGVPDIMAAQQAVAGSEYAARYNIEYFENKAVPRHLITLKGATLGAAAMSDLLTFFETGLKGQNHRSLFIPLPADTANSKVEFDIDSVDANVQESSFHNYIKMNTNQILMAHRVPLTKISVGDSVSLAVARDADKTFKEQVCGPQQRILEKKLNRIVKELTDAYELKLNEMTLTDEDTQSKIDERRRKTGVETANEQRIRRGMPTIKGGDELVDLNAASKIAAARSEESANRQRDSERSAAASDSAGEARQPKGEGRASE